MPADDAATASGPDQAGVIEPGDPRGVAAAVTGAVVRLDGDVDADLVVVEQHAGEGADRHPAERPVVGAAAAAEPQPVGGDREPGHQHDVGGGDASTPSRGADRLEQPAAGGRQRVGPVVDRPVEVVVGQQHRQDHPLAGARRARRAAAPVPGSVPTETYAATVAARRTSSRRAGGRRSAAAASPTSASGSRRRAVSSWSRSAELGALSGPGPRGRLRRLAPGQPTIEAWVVAGLNRARDKMAAAGVDEVAIETFAHYYRLLEHGETGMIPESTIEPLDMEALADVEVADEDAAAAIAQDRRDQAQRRARHVDGHGPRQVAAVRAPRAVLPRHHRPAGAAPARGVRRPAAADLHEQLPHLRATPWRRWRATRTSPVDGLPLEFLQNKEPKLLAKDLSPVSCPKDPDLEWCPPGHGDLYTALRGTGLLDRLIDAGYRYVFVSNSDNLGAVPDARVAGWFAALRCAVRDRGGAPYAVGPQGRPLRAPQDRRPDRAARDARRRWTRTGRRSPTSTGTGSLLDQQPVVRPARDAATALDRRGGILGLPLIRNVKNVDPGDPTTPEVIQIETAMGAAIEVFEGARTIEVGRDRFVPVKTTNDLLVLRSDVYDLGQRLRARPGCRRGAVRRARRRLLQAASASSTSASPRARRR